MTSLKSLLYALLSQTHLDDILDAINPEEPAPPEIDYSQIPELNGKMLRFEAKKLGLKLSDYTDDELRKRVIDAMHGVNR